MFSELAELKKRLKELAPLMSRGYKTEEELENDQELMEMAKEYGAIQRRVSHLSWAIKNDNEKTEKRIEKIAMGEKYINENQNVLRVAYMKDYVALIELLTKMKEYTVIDEEASAFLSGILSQLQQSIFIGLVV